MIDKWTGHWQSSSNQFCCEEKHCLSVCQPCYSSCTKEGSTASFLASFSMALFLLIADGHGMSSSEQRRRRRRLSALRRVAVKLEPQSPAAQSSSIRVTQPRRQFSPGELRAKPRVSGRKRRDPSSSSAPFLLLRPVHEGRSSEVHSRKSLTGRSVRTLFPCSGRVMISLPCVKCLVQIEIRQEPTSAQNNFLPTCFFLRSPNLNLPHRSSLPPPQRTECIITQRAAFGRPLVVGWRETAFVFG